MLFEIALVRKVLIKFQFFFRKRFSFCLKWLFSLVRGIPKFALLVCLWLCVCMYKYVYLFLSILHCDVCIDVYMKFYVIRLEID